MKNKIAIVLCITFLVTSCNHQKTLTADKIINNSIDTHGGWEQWESLNLFEYDKRFSLYDEDGNTEKSVHQTHSYKLKDRLQGAISWKDSVEHEVVFDNGSAYFIHDGEREKTTVKARDNFMSAYYVLNMPWKLKDKGTIKFYEGIKKLYTGQEVHSIQVEYPNEAHNDKWWYFFDTNDYKLVANMVHHVDYYSLILNHEFATYQGLVWNSSRTSFRCDEHGQPTYKRAIYSYEYPK